MSHRYDTNDEDDVWAYDGDLDLDPSAESLDHVSKSRIKTFLTCPRQFAFTYWSEERESGNFYTERGTQVHDAFEQFHRNLLEYVSDNGERPERFTSLMGDSDNWHQWIEYIGSFFDWQERRWQECDGELGTWLPLGLEREIRVPDPPAGELEWMGRYDTLHDAASIPGVSDEGVVVVDYKTGSVKDPKYRDTGIHIDLEYYAWLLEHRGHDVTAGVGFYPKENETVIREMPNPDIRETMKDVAEQITAEPTVENYPIDSQPLCSWCHFEDQCPSTW